jgi:hypothetical protein
LEQYTLTAFHQRTLELANRRCETVPRSEASVRALEAILRQPIPASLRELLVSNLWPALLAEFSNCDRPIEVDEMARPKWSQHSALDAALLPFMVENQGVCTWAVRLNGADDPEVLVEVDSGDPPEWQPAASTFSAWLNCQVNDHMLTQRALFTAQAEPLAPATLAELERTFSVGPRTYGWPAPVVHRFSIPSGSILLWAADDQCDWWIAPSSLGNARELLEALPLSRGFDGWSYELKPEALPVFEAWRRAMPR